MQVREFQAIIGQETRWQFEQQVGGKPDILLACVGGGSNAMGESLSQCYQCFPLKHIRLQTRQISSSKFLAFCRLDHLEIHSCAQANVSQLSFSNEVSA